MSILDKPVIKYFRTNAEEVMVNDEVLLEWEVENARRVRLDGVEMEARGSYSLFINDSRTFELTASNWKGRESEQLTVRLFKPVVLRFETDSTTIRENEPVNIHLELKNTQSWRITADYGSAFANKRETIAEGKIENSSGIYTTTVQAPVKGTCVLTLTTRNGFETGISETVRLYARSLHLELRTNQTVVKAGSFVRVTWKAQHANRIFLNPGNVDVTDLTHYDFKVESDRDILLELKAFGDFGQQMSDTKNLYLAKINSVWTSNNGDPANPVFYLNWSATGLQNLKLLPGNIPVNENEINFQIPAQTSVITYILTGQTYSGEEVAETIILHPCAIGHFQLEKGKVIIGAMATLVWEIKNAKKIQIKFSDSAGAIDIPVAEPRHHFQVFKGRDKVKLLAWGDINLVELEIPIQAFESPLIKALSVPTLSFALSITWVPSPLVKPARKITELFFLTNNVTTRGRSFYRRIWSWLGGPSSWMLRINKKVPREEKNRANAAIATRTIAQKISSGPESVFAVLDENFKKINNEQ